MIFYKVQTILCLYYHKLTAATLFYLFINSFFFFFFLLYCCIAVRPHARLHYLLWENLCIHITFTGASTLYSGRENVSGV